MGLRKLLGLPPKKSKKSAPPPPSPSNGDAATFDAAKQKFDTVHGHPGLALLTDAQRDTLVAAKKEAVGLAAHDLFNDAAKRLNDAVGVAAGQIAKAKTAKVDYEANKVKITNVLNATARWGLPADHKKKLQDRFDAIVAGSDADITTAATALEKMGRDLSKDAAIKQAKAAYDKVVRDKDRVEAEATEALKVAKETPDVLKQNRILANAVTNIGWNAGKLNFIEAARYIEVCEACIAIINTEAPKIAAAIALRDDVIAKRKLLAADVDAARLIYGTNDEAEGLIEEFQGLDKSFEGAMYAKDYKVAGTYLKRLESAAKRVLELKPAMDADEQVRADRKIELKTVRSEYKKVKAVPAATGELDRIYKTFKAKIDAYFVAYNAKEWETATSLVPEIQALRVKYLAAAEDAAEELAKNAEAVDLWEKDCKKRYGKLDKIRATTPEMTAAIADARAAFTLSNAKLISKDFTAALTSGQALKGHLDTVDGLKAANDDANKARNAAWTEYKKSQALCNEALAIKPNTPEMAALYKAFSDVHQAFHTERKKGVADVLTKLPDVIAKAQAVVDGKDANAAKADEGKTAAEAAKSAAIAAYQAAKAIGDKYVPTSQTQLDAQTAVVIEFNGLLQAGRYMEAIDCLTRLEAANKAIVDAEAQWITDAQQAKAAYDTRYGLIKTDYDKVAIYQAVLPGLGAEVAAVVALKQGADGEYAGNKIGKADALLDKLGPAVALLLPKKAAHDVGLADKTWLDVKIGSIGTDVQDACDAFAAIPETQDIQNRLKYAKKVSDAAIAAHDYSKSRPQWVEMERLLALWTAKEQENNDAYSDDAKESTRRLRAFGAERTIAADIKGITPELKKMRDAFFATSKRYWQARGALDWPLSLEVIDAYEAAAKALAAKKGEFDAAVLAAQPVAAAATQELTAISDSDLKAKPTDEKLKLLDDMRATGEDLTPAQRKLQRKLYSSLDYDPAFKAADEKRRDELVDALKADTDVMEARDKWGTMDDDARLAVLVKVLNAECKVFNVPPPAVRLFYTPPGDEGFFSGATMTLNLNTHQDSGWTDYKEAVNTVVHENMHNYQEVLVRRLNEGIITKEDPEYVQALIFASNDAPGGYVDTDEEPDADEVNQKPYKTQPVEAHAWDSGDGVAGDLMAADPPEEDAEY